MSHRSGRLPQTYVKSEAAITVFELLMMGGLSPETCWEIKKLWNNKFYYTVASCWLFLYDLYHDARIHEQKKNLSYNSVFYVLREPELQISGIFCLFFFFVFFLHFDCQYIILQTSHLFNIYHLERTELGVNQQRQHTLINTGNGECEREFWTTVVIRR